MLLELAPSTLAKCTIDSRNLLIVIFLTHYPSKLPTRGTRDNTFFLDFDILSLFIMIVGIDASSNTLVAIVCVLNGILLEMDSVIIFDSPVLKSL
ncbi:hypothetical protein RRF57_012623 [Xylaria bambusicola]|uniref:Uncharacterized protein n=1 Tax=Xylaria bambusicola TaxID=326684 RepID=A0AAN7V0S1_9PEZI